MLGEYLPVLLQILVADSLRRFRVGCQCAGRQKRKTYARQGYSVRMRHDSPGGTPAALQREVLCRGDAFYPVRHRDRVHVPVGSRVPRRNQAEQRHFLEHAQLHHDPDGGLRLRSQKRRLGF